MIEYIYFSVAFIIVLIILINLYMDKEKIENQFKTIILIKLV